MPTAAGEAEMLRQALRPMPGTDEDLDPVIDAAAGSRFVVIGEATHGTHEFYSLRAALTQRLIRDYGFNAVAVEADWPDAYQVNRYVQCESSHSEAALALSTFGRFPRWMWRNVVVLDFVAWLRRHNESVPPERRVGFYGLDVYSLHASMALVVTYLEQVEPEAAARARERYSSFDHYARDPEQYDFLTDIGLDPAHEHEVAALLEEMRLSAEQDLAQEGLVERDAPLVKGLMFAAAQHAGAYYRGMYRGDAGSWNLRERHMAATLEALAAHLHREQGRAHIVVWAHNAHAGDARATEMARRHELSLGQLVRAAHGVDSTLVGFTTYAGLLTTAREWNGPAGRVHLSDALPHSCEALFHATGLGSCQVVWRESPDAEAILDRPRLERGVGMVYRPETERVSHYFESRLPRRFDAVIHVDHTTAVEPLDPLPEWEPFRTAGISPSELQ